MTSIPARELRNDYARVLREVQEGQVYTITDRGRPVAQITPLSEEEDGARDLVAFGEIAGALGYLGPSRADELRRQLDDAFDVDVADPSMRAAAQRAEVAARKRNQ